MILYLGNALSKHGYTPAMMETLAPKLAGKHQLLSYSTKKNQLLRFLDIILAVIRHRRVTSLIIIDTFSTLAFWYFVAVATLCRFFAIPYIPVLRGGDLPARVARQSAFLNKSFAYAAVNISPSAYLKRGFDKLGYKTICIPNFLEMEKYPFKKRSALQARLLWVRAIHRIYNPGLAIRLVHALKDLYPDITLCMVGPDKDGSLEKMIALARELNVEEKVRFTGKLSKADWINLSTDFDIFINTTDVDNMPVSVIEAMALGLPVVSTNVGGVPDLIDPDKDGLLVAKDNLEEFKSAVIQLLADPGLGVALSNAARKKAESFSWERVGPLWDEVIRTYQKKN